MHVLKRWGWLWWESGHLFCVPDTDDIKQKNKKTWNNTKQIFPEQKTKKPLSYIIFVQYTKFWPEFGLHKYLDKLWIHLVKESVQLTVSLGISTSCMLRIEKLTTFNMTCAWTFHNSLLRLIVVITFIILMNCTLKTLLHVIYISVIMFAPYCYLQTISCQVWL